MEFKKKKYNEDRLPVYEIVINPDDESGVRMISLVDDPAIEVMGMTFAKKKKWKSDGSGNALPPVHPNCRCYLEMDDDGYSNWRIEPDGCDLCYEKRDIFNAGVRRSKNREKKGKGDLNAPKSSGFESMEFTAIEEKRIIVGPAMIPDKKIFRRNDKGDYYVVFTKDVIRQIVDKFNKGNNNKSINVDHSNRMVNGFLQQNWIVEDAVYDKSKFYGYDLPVGSWFVEMKIEDEDFWKSEVKELGKYGFSVEGLLGHKLIEMSAEKTCTCGHCEEDEFNIDEFIDELTEDEVKDLIAGLNFAFSVEPDS